MSLARQLHKCDVPLCVRDDHLFPGTLKDNSQDMTDKGRHPGQKLTAVQAQEIRARYAKANITQRALAIEYHVSPALIGFILTDRVWKQT